MGVATQAGDETVIGLRFRKTIAGEKVFRERTTDRLGPDSVPEEDTLVHTALDDIGQPVEHPENMVLTDCCHKLLRRDSVQQCPSCQSLSICSKHMTRWHMCRSCFYKDLPWKIGYWIGWTVKWTFIVIAMILIGFWKGILSFRSRPAEDSRAVTRP